MRSCQRSVQTLLALALLAGAPLVFAGEQFSGFLDNYPEMSPDPDRPGAVEWTKPGVDRSQYTKVMLEPLSIIVDPQSEYKGLSSSDVQALADGFRDAVVATLEPEIPVVQVAGSGVLYMRAALTGVELKKQKRGILGYTPVGFVVTAVKDAVGKRISLQKAALEIEVLDSQTGERVGVIIDRDLSEKGGSKHELSWKSIQDTLNFYATRFKARMLAVRQEAARKP
ncbi:MAG: DUF3313 domain-containing protein [Acidobacteriia bacterium]|nr:DUF3313 domain-containing protein [Terriglobia bacterium]